MIGLSPCKNGCERLSKCAPTNHIHTHTRMNYIHHTKARTHVRDARAKRGLTRTHKNNINPSIPLESCCSLDARALGGCMNIKANYPLTMLTCSIRTCKRIYVYSIRYERVARHAENMHARNAKTSPIYCCCCCRAQYIMCTLSYNTNQRKLA